MIIDKNNLCNIEKIHLHDALFKNIIYDHLNKTITICFESEWEDVDYLFEFKNLLYYEMTCCDFWGGGFNVVSWSVSDCSGIPDKILIKAQNENPESSSYMDLSDYFVIEIIINSGDKLKIFCSSVVITEIS